MFSAQEPTSIQKMFNQIAKKYDLANSVLSLGTHWVWKKRLVEEVKLCPGQKILDCATGTGDIAFLLEKMSQTIKSPSPSITGIDFSESMLAVALKKANEAKSQVVFKFADVERLPFKNGEFDTATISFGLRNVKDTKKALLELARVVKPGGKVIILEFGQPQKALLREAYGLYSKQILPRLGGIISGQKQAYKYLQTSSAAFPCGEKLCKLAQDLDVFDSTKFYELSFGIAYLYVFLV